MNTLAKPPSMTDENKPVAARTPVADIMEAVLIKGDLAKLTPDERVRYYGEVCKSIGLNPLTKPFEFITLNGKLQLYALRAATDQLRKMNGVSLEILSREVSDDVLTVHVRAKLPDGRSDEDFGAVAYPQTLRGEARANAELKAVTKAKRRATLSICGLGWLDETEIEDIPARAKAEAAVANGTSIMHPDDYADGTPEKLTKPVEASKFQRLEMADERWRDKIEGWMLAIDEQQTKEELDAWCSKHTIEVGSIPERHKDLKMAIYRKVRLKREGLIANQVVHDDDEPRPATMADFYDDAQDENPIGQSLRSISERAIKTREER